MIGSNVMKQLNKTLREPFRDNHISDKELKKMLEGKNSWLHRNIV